MEFELVVGRNPLDESIDALVCPCFEDEGLPEAIRRFTAEYELPELDWVVADGEFDGSSGERTMLHVGGRTEARRLLLMGIGSRSDVSLKAIRHAVADAVKHCREVGCARVGFLLPDADRGLETNNVITAVVEASYLGLYTFTRYKTGLVQAPEDVPRHADPAEGILFLDAATVEEVGGATMVRDALEFGEALSRAANVTKDICNEPSNVMTPRELVKEGLAVVGAGDDFTVEVLDEGDIRKKGMDLIWAVGKGSTEPPRLMLVCYTGNPKDSRYWGVVGKGVTFDSGGISLKRSEGMFQMKRDLTGAGTVVGLMDAMRRLKPPINVAGLIVSAENMPDARSFKPGDIYTSYSGKSVEIFSTDAEGRLLLADSLAYLQQQVDLHGIITIATLTGAALAAVGPSITPVLGRPQSLVDAIKQAGAQSGERYWELPFDDDYMPRVKSHFADIKTDSPKPPGVIAAAMFIREFVAAETPWIHLDIAGTSSANQPSGVISRGATGVSVRSLLRFLLGQPELSSSSNGQNGA